MEQNPKLSMKQDVDYYLSLVDTKPFKEGEDNWGKPWHGYNVIAQVIDPTDNVRKDVKYTLFASGPVHNLIVASKVKAKELFKIALKSFTTKDGQPRTAWALNDKSLTKWKEDSSMQDKAVEPNTDNEIKAITDEIKSETDNKLISDLTRAFALIETLENTIVVLQDKVVSVESRLNRLEQ